MLHTSLAPSVGSGHANLAAQTHIANTTDQLIARVANLFHQLRQSADHGQRVLVVHHTNFVIVNDQANVTLALGASPIMSSEELEQADLIRVASSVLLNIGTIHRDQRATMLQAAYNAKKHGVPVILDPVGVGASHYRARVTQDLLETGSITVIKGNAAEIGFLAGNNEVSVNGVDGAGQHKDPANVVRSLAQKYNCVVVMHGPIDWLSDGTTTIKLSNGHERMSNITGTGCSTGSAVASFVAQVAVAAKANGQQRPSLNDVLEAAVAGVLATSIAGELAASRSSVSGNSSYRTQWIDEISSLDGDVVKRVARLKVVH